MIWAIVLNGTTGFIMTVTFAYCIGPLDAAIHPPYFFAFIGTFYNATGSKAAATVMTCISPDVRFCARQRTAGCGFPVVRAAWLGHSSELDLGVDVHHRIAEFDQPGLDGGFQRHHQHRRRQSAFKL